MTMKKTRRFPRGEGHAPLLPSVSSESTESNHRKQQKRGFQRLQLFRRSKSAPRPSLPKEEQTTHHYFEQDLQQQDIHSLPAPMVEQSTSVVAAPVTAPTKPIAALQENTKDSVRKNREAVRKVRSTDPPDRNDSNEQQEQHIINESLPAITDDILEASVQATTTTTATQAATNNITTTPTLVHTSKQVLSRPFGRQGLPKHIARRWVVQISSAEWDADDWRYRIIVQNRDLQQTTQSTTTTTESSSSNNSMTAAFTYRNIAEFYWLEHALVKEFQGALLVPPLSIATRIVNPQTSTPVEAEKLRDWLSDILNGVRGQGEVLLPYDPLEVLKSEAMEAFLYRKDALPREENVNEAYNNISHSHPDQSQSFVSALWKNGLELCAGPTPVGTTIRRKLPVEMLLCSSRALGSGPSFDVQDSIADTASLASPRASNPLVIHSEVLEAERELAMNYRKTALKCMEKLQLCLIQEERIGIAWKRLAIALSNLFTYEKDVENAKLGDFKVKRENMPYRKISKSHVEDCLRKLSRQKMDRNIPALQALQNMLTAYVADLSAVQPAVDAYSEGIVQLAMLEEPSGNENPKVRKNWEGHMKALAMSMNDVRKQAMKTLNGEEGEANDILPADDGTVKTMPLMQRRMLQQKLMKNERTLRDSLTSLCQATPIRVARMAWTYWNTEAAQCSMLKSASAALRGKLIFNEDNRISTASNHLEQEKEDVSTELDLVQKVISIGNAKKFAVSENTPTEVAADIEIDNDSMDREREIAMKRDKALQLARDNVGRWNSYVAISIMDAIGIDNPNIHVDDTTRDLRLIQKYAVGLREKVNRCKEAVELLEMAIKKGLAQPSLGDAVSPHSQSHIRDCRQAFLVDLAKLFSGKYIETPNQANERGAQPSMSILAKSGVDVSDPMGWGSAIYPNSKGSKHALTQGQLGDLAMVYMDCKDDDSEWFLTTLSDLVKGYYERVEAIESFVYMECVGIQLEKHFSQKRVSTLNNFEKKTDIIAALNVAVRKQMPQLINELRAKMEALGPDVTHTHVKETKEAHLESKTLKGALHDLAVRRLTRAREVSTERVIEIMEIWGKHEESSATKELKALTEAMIVLERLVDTQEDLLYLC